MKRWLLDENGLTWVAELLLGAVVLSGVFGIPLFNPPLWVAVPIGVIALVGGAILMFEGRASAIGIKPFTSDPLGWRKAKESYKTPDDVAANATKDDVS